MRPIGATPGRASRPARATWSVLLALGAAGTLASAQTPVLQPQPVLPAQGLPAPPKQATPVTAAPVLPSSSGLQPQLIQPPLQIQPLLHGFVDLHTHPLSYLGFGGKLIYGAVDAGSWLPPENPPPLGTCYQPNAFQAGIGGATYTLGVAGSEQDALSYENPVHGGPGTNNACGDAIRDQVIHQLQEQTNAYDPDDSTYTSSGSPNFASWPAWNDVTRQRMWVEWIRRAYTAGLRVMVALAVNNKTLGDMTRGPGDLPDDDMTSADLQIAQITAFVRRHPDFMALAYSSQDVYNIVAGNKLAVVVGVEIDNIGNFKNDPLTQPPMPTQVITQEIDRLYAEGVRYVFPVHLLDNPFGGTAAYQDIFNAANFREEGHYWRLICSQPIDGISYVYNPGGFNPLFSAGVLAKLGLVLTPPGPPSCAPGIGDVNSMGLSANGQVALLEMMRLGMLIDIDHMSQRSVTDTFAFVGGHVAGGYPLNSGHNGLRGAALPGAPPPTLSERSLTASQYQTIASWHGMAGVGSAGLNAYQWFTLYNTVIQAMGPNVVGGFGTDLDGMERGMPPHPQAAYSTQTVATNPQYTACYNSCAARVPGCPAGKPSVTCLEGRTTALRACQTQCQAQNPTQFNQVQVCVSAYGLCVPPVQYSASFPAPTDGNRTWNYNTDGVVHYGMLADFLQDVALLPGGAAMLNNNFMYGADYFYHTWQRAEAQRANVHP